MPPESNVTPFPTKATVFFAFAGQCSKITILGLFMLPAATASMAPNFFFFSSFSLNTVTLRSSFLAWFAIDWAKSSGRLSFGGILTHSLARIVPRQTVEIRDGNRLYIFASSAFTKKSIRRSDRCFFSFLYLS